MKLTDEQIDYLIDSLEQDKQRANIEVLDDEDGYVRFVNGIIKVLLSLRSC